MKALRKQLPYFLLPLFFIQLGKHFWPDASLVLGRRIDYLSPTFHLFDGVIIGFFCLQLPLLWSKGWFKWVILIFLLTWGFMIVFSQFPQVAFFSGFRWLIMLFLLTGIVAARPGLRLLQKTAAVSIIFVTILALAQFLAQRALGGWLYWLGERSYTVASGQVAHLIVSSRLLVRPYGTFSHPNVLGGVLVTLLPWLLFFKIKTKGEFLLIQAARILTLFGIALSFSRAAWFVGALVIIMFGLQRLRITKKNLLFALFTVLCLFIIEELSFGWLAQLTELQNKSVYERQQLAQSALTLISRQPITGFGFGHFIPLLPTVSRPPFLLQPVHSVYLLAAVEIGLPLTLVLIFYLFRLLWLLKQRKSLALFWSLGAILLLGLVDHYFWSTPQPQALAVLLIGLALAETHSSALQ